MDEAALRKALHTAGRRRTKALDARDAASTELKALIPQAQQAGMTITEIARVAGLSRMGVYDLTGGRGSR